MGTNKLLKGKPEGGFRSFAAVLPSSGFALAVFAAAVMVLAGYDSLGGAGTGDGSVFSAEAGPAEDSGGGGDGFTQMLTELGVNPLQSPATDPRGNPCPRATTPWGRRVLTPRTARLPAAAALCA